MEYQVLQPTYASRCYLHLAHPAAKLIFLRADSSGFTFLVSVLVFSFRS